MTVGASIVAATSTASVTSTTGSGGGAAGAFAKPDALDVKLSFEDLRAAGLPLGSGAILILNETRDVRDVLARLGHFFAHESCGKCVPCRVGTRKMLGMLTAICQGRATLETVEQLKRLCETVQKASLCGLGVTAPNPVLTTLRYFEDEYLAHIVDKRCPAGACRMP